MKKNTVSLAKITPPKISNIVQRKRLYKKILNKEKNSPILWISSPAGSGKTTLIAGYLADRKLKCLWYQIDEGDADISTFFYYMGLAAKKANPRKRKPLPLLTPEYLAGIPTFTRRYFEELYGRLIPRTTLPSIPSHQGRGRVPSPLAGEGRGEGGVAIVFDNYQDVPADSAFHEMITRGMDIIPEGIQAVFISRHEPPAAFSRLRANNRISLLGWNEVRFTLEETEEIIKAHDPSTVTHPLDGCPVPRKLKAQRYGEMAKLLHERTDGWAAGLVLMTGAIESGVTDDAGQEIPTFDTSAIFDYFAAELFEKANREIQNFLLKTAFLPSMTANIAEMLTGEHNAGSILLQLSRNHYFTNRLAGDEPIYRYHPLFREFLLSRIKSRFTPDESAAIQKDAAILLEQLGQIEDAARLFCSIKDCENIARIIIHYAKDLLRQGRHRTVEEWMSCLPAEAIDANPWLLFWTGICSFPLDMPRTKKYLEKSFESFKAVNDAAGIYLSWAGIVDAYSYELEEWERLDDCIVMLNDIRKRHPSFPSKEIELLVSSRMLIALTLRKTDKPGLVHKWLERILKLLRENPSIDIQMDTLFFMSIYYIWRGEYDKNTILFEKANAEIFHNKPSPLAVIRMKMIEAVHYWVTGQYDAALNTVSEGLALSEKSGVHLFDFLLLCWKASTEMLTGNMGAAQKSLKQIQSLLNYAKTLDTFYYHINSAWYEILSGNIHLAIEHMETTSAQIAKLGTPYYRALWNIGMASIEFSQGRTKNANAHLQTAYRISLNMKSHVLEWFCLLNNAYFLLKEGNEKEGLKSLHSGLLLGKSHGYAHIEFYQPSIMQFLYAKALEAGIEKEYVKELIRRHNLNPPFEKGGQEGIFVDDWPYPVKIYTLGRFELLKDDKPIIFSRKTSKKPLEMLKRLIAFGGKDVSGEDISDALWPDAEGDAAHYSFKWTLHQLRGLLGNEKFIEIKGLQKDDRSKTDKSKIKQITGLSEKAILLYKGHFLKNDLTAPWSSAMRERLKGKFLYLIDIAGTYYENIGQWEKAKGLYEKAVETEALHEEFYRRIMLCCQKSGRIAEALSVYNRYRTLFNTLLKIEPSKELESLYNTLRSKNHS